MPIKNIMLTLCAFFLIIIARPVTLPGMAAELSCADMVNCDSAWLTLDKQQTTEIFAFADGYKNFLHEARSSLSFVEKTVIMARKAGFRPLEKTSPLTAGKRYYSINRNRSLSLMVIGKKPPDQGMRIIGAHIDSPHLALKGRPLYESGEFALFQTMNHGGIKNHQWTNIPLALIGRVDKKDGSHVTLNIGLKNEDPIFMIAELSPHVDRGYGDKKVKNHIKTEDLDPIVGHIPTRLNKTDPLALQVLAALKTAYDLSPADLVSAELALVPAFPPRDMGFDRGLVAAYGQDDRVAAYAAIRALTAVETPDRTLLTYLVDNEEVGNRNNTGAGSRYFSDLIAELLEIRYGTAYRESHLRKTLARSKMLSIDVNPGLHPLKPGAWEKGNAPRLGHGINIKLYGQGNNAHSDYIAWTRAYLDKAQIPWQTTTYKVGAAGGGTIGGEFSRQNMAVIDIGIPLLSIHSPTAISSKVDIFHLYKTIMAFQAAP